MNTHYTFKNVLLTLPIINAECLSIVSISLVAAVNDTITTGKESMNIVQLVRSIDDHMPSFSQCLCMLTPERKLGCSVEQS